MTRKFIRGHKTLNWEKSRKNILLSNIDYKSLFVEHFIYSAAVAVLVGMVYFNRYSRDPSLIIVIIAMLPDIDFLISQIEQSLNIPSSLIITHGDFHNTLSLLVISIICALFFTYLGFSFIDGFVCVFIGYFAHFVCDFLVGNPSYPFLWPFSNIILSYGLLSQEWDFFGIANINVLFLGIILLFFSIIVRQIVEGKYWWVHFFRLSGDTKI